MKENTRTWLLAGLAAALAAFAGLVYHLYPGIVARSGLDRDSLGAGAMAALVLWLALRKQKPMTGQARIALMVASAAGLLVGLAVFFIS
jgi:hypothetical protein